jgi:hypothetical protein
MTSEDIQEMKAMAALENRRVFGVPFARNPPPKKPAPKPLDKERDTLSLGASRALELMKDGRERTVQDVAVKLRMKGDEVKCYLTKLRRMRLVRHDKLSTTIVYIWKITDKGMDYQI